MFKIPVCAASFNQGIKFSACSICKIAVQHVPWKTEHYFLRDTTFWGLYQYNFIPGKKMKVFQGLQLPSYKDLEML